MMMVMVMPCVIFSLILALRGVATATATRTAATRLCAGGGGGVPLRPAEEARRELASYNRTALLGSVLASRSQAAAAAGEEAAATGFIRTASGLEYSDVKLGEGPEALAGKSVQFQWVLWRFNGYFVDASSNYGDEGDGNFIYMVGNRA